MVDFWVALGTVFVDVWSFLATFFNSNFFQGFSTILTVIGAVILYLGQKNAEKQRIAAALVNEIRNAEESINSLKNRPAGLEIPEIIILPQNSWGKYSHLFTKDLDQDQINTINRFYFEAERANYIVSRGNTVDLFLSNIKARTEAAHQKVLDIVATASKKRLKAEMKEFSDKFYNQDSFFAYSPNGFPNQLDLHLKNITLILDSPAGIKLKELAGVQDKKKKFFLY